VSAKKQPDFLTVEQAAEVIGFGRTKTYALARKAADYGEGPFPAIRFGPIAQRARNGVDAFEGSILWSRVAHRRRLSANVSARRRGREISRMCLTVTMTQHELRH
jgi:hypothetical protein